MGLNDTWEKNTFVPFDYFLQLERLLIKGTCSTRLILSDILSTYQGELFHLSKFLGQFVYLSGYLFTFLRQFVALSGGYVVRCYA